MNKHRVFEHDLNRHAAEHLDQQGDLARTRVPMPLAEVVNLAPGNAEMVSNYLRCEVVERD